MFNSKTILLFFIISALLAPAFVSAELGLEQTYPQIYQGGQEITVTGKTSISGLIKYYSTWAVIIAILVVIISLIAGGLQYVTSAGKPEAMTQARNRIAKSFLGLAILVSSYMILRVVNPQMNILQIKKVPITTGIVALTKCGVDGYDPMLPLPLGACKDTSMDGKGLLAGTSLTELIDLNHARYISSSFVLDMTKILGRMVVFEYNGDPADSANHTKLNFEEIPLYALGLWGDDAENIKITTYTEKGILGPNPNEYTYKGKIDWDWNVIRASQEINDIHIIRLDVALDEDFPSSEVDYINEDAVFPESNEVTKSIVHPPLSMIVEGIGPGIYLYSANAGVQAYFKSDSVDFITKDFNDKAEKIEIRNKSAQPGASDEEHNYLAILFDDPGFGGSFRIFFQKI